MTQLYNVSTSPSKTWKTFPGGDHNSSVLEEGYFEAILEFIADALGSSAPITDGKSQ